MVTIEENWTGPQRGIIIYGTYQKGQSFTIGITGENKFFDLTSIQLYGRNVAPPPFFGGPGMCYVELYAASDSGLPTGSVLSSGNFNVNDISTTNSLISVTMSAVRLSPSTQYCIVIRVPAGDISAYLNLIFTDTDTYTGGTYLRTESGVWKIRSNEELYFRVLGTVVACSALTTQADCEVASCYWYDGACHTNPYFEGTRDVYASGFTARFQKRQIIGYFPVSGDLRSIVINASGHLLTDIEIEVSSGLWVDGVSGVHVYQESGAFVTTQSDIGISGTVTVESGLGVLISGQHVFVESGVYLASGICPVTADIIKTGPVRVITAASGGEVLYSGVILSLCVKASENNATDIYLGGVAPYRPYSGFGFCLGNGETKCYDINNFSDVYLCATTSGDRVCFDGISL